MLDKYEKDIEKNLDPSQKLVGSARLKEISELKAAAKEHLGKKR